jgi:demethylmenaquinone methyltransferase/2-methoxy-6-polyprenyl-1,4-benzoquinol methylase
MRKSVDSSQLTVHTLSTVDRELSTLMSIHDRIATPDGKRRYVRSLFATIADRYDLITVVLSFGQDRRWKRRLVRLAAPRPDQAVLDLATGTGDIAFAVGKHAGHVIGLDVTLRMIELAKAKAGERRTNAGTPRFLVGDMVALPFRDASFDLVTTGYGLRNVPDLQAAVGEIRRVLKPGGQTLSLDFNRPANALVRAVYLRYLALVGGALGWILHRDPDTYRYIPASIRTYPGAAGVARLMEAAGLTRVRHFRVLGGLMTIHQGYKPSHEA